MSCFWFWFLLNVFVLLYDCPSKSKSSVVCFLSLYLSLQLTPCLCISVCLFQSPSLSVSLCSCHTACLSVTPAVECHVSPSLLYLHLPHFLCLSIHFMGINYVNFTINVIYLYSVVCYLLTTHKALYKATT